MLFEISQAGGPPDRADTWEHFQVIRPDPARQGMREPNPKMFRIVSCRAGGGGGSRRKFQFDDRRFLRSCKLAIHWVISRDCLETFSSFYGRSGQAGNARARLQNVLQCKLQGFGY